MQERQVVINAIMSVAQIVVISGVLFILYKFLLNSIGVEQLGIWSVVLATTSVANIANLGLSASVVKFVAKYLAHGEDESVAGVIQTAAISMSILIGFVLLFAYPLANYLLSLLIPIAKLKVALSILPYALLSLWGTVIAGVFLAGLDGCQRIDIRSMLFMGSAVFHLFLCFLLVPIYGLMGLAYVQVIQAWMLLILSWFLLKSYLPTLPAIPWRWNRRIFSEMVDYGINFQVMSISSMLFEPTTKALLSRFGGLAMVGYYEMASRMISQIRALIVSANQVLVPVIADLHERNQEVIQGIYKATYRLIFYIGLPFLSIIIVLVPLISEIWIGHYESLFVFFAILLAVGWFLNILAGPAYFANLGTGDLRWNTVSHVTIAVLNGGLGLLFGIYYGGTGVVIAFVFSLVAGSLIIPVSYHVQHKILLKELLPRENIVVGLTSGTGILVTMLLYYEFRSSWSLMAVSILIILTFFSIIFVPIWLHPMRKRLTGLITTALVNTSV